MRAQMALPALPPRRVERHVALDLRTPAPEQVLAHMRAARR